MSEAKLLPNHEDPNYPWLYKFNEVAQIEKRVNGDWDRVRGLLGGKGAGLARMTELKLPVPFGFTITTEACTYFMKTHKKPAGLWNQVLSALQEVEKVNGRKFGAKQSPLLVSCRSGAKFSMPGMMDTILNIGLNDENIESFGKETNPRFVADSYRRLIQSFGSIVLGLGDEKFEELLKHAKKSKGYDNDLQLTTADLQELQSQYKAVILKETGEEFPQDPLRQLELSIEAVHRSWNGKRAFDYRNKTGVAHDLGTAVNIQTMVFGNMGDSSATGVAFTRNPATGEKLLYGDYLKNAQGEDVVSGIRNCCPVREMGQEFPQAFADLMNICGILERWFKNMQDIEFTIQEGKIYMLQCRDGKRTAQAQVTIAVDMVDEGLITKAEAIQRISPADVNTLLLPQLDPAALKKARAEGRLIAKGVNASPGGAVGRVVFDSNVAEERKKAGEDVILVRPFTKPEDVHGFFAAKGVLTAEGGATSHASVVARQFGLPCIVGAHALNIDLKRKQFTLEGEGRANVVVKEGDLISLNATDGEVFLGNMPTVSASFSDQVQLRKILDWADEVCVADQSTRGTKGESMPGLQVLANCDNALEAKRAREFGAHGVGLCRTEHMFFEPQRLPIVQDMILAKDATVRQNCLDRLIPFQRADFEGIFTEMSGLPVIIRVLDPPLHEFLPDYKKLLSAVEDLAIKVATGHPCEAELKEKKELLESVEAMHESNPMMGLRGCRLSIMLPAILHMQVRAILEAAINVNRRGKKAMPYIMIPLTSHVNELRDLKVECEKVAAQVLQEQNVDVQYYFGTMVETPRAALTAGAIAEVAEFFSFGTNDLTQMTYGICRDDAERAFLLEYVERGILPANPFQTLDEDGVGKLIEIATRDGRAKRDGMSVGICGEVGGDPATIKLCYKYGLGYVSCSPFRVPIARLAVALASLSKKQ